MPVKNLLGCTLPPGMSLLLASGAETVIQSREDGGPQAFSMLLSCRSTIRPFPGSCQLSFQSLFLSLRLLLSIGDRSLHRAPYFLWIPVRLSPEACLIFLGGSAFEGAWGVRPLYPLDVFVEIKLSQFHQGKGKYQGPRSIPQDRNSAMQKARVS